MEAPPTSQTAGHTASAYDAPFAAFNRVLPSSLLSSLSSGGSFPFLPAVKDWPHWLREPGNPDLQVPRDITDLLWYTLAWAIAHFLIVRLVLKPLSRALIAPPSSASARPDHTREDAIEGCSSSTTSAPRIRQRKGPSSAAAATTAGPSTLSLHSTPADIPQTSPVIPRPRSSGAIAPVDDRFKFVLSAWKFFTYGTSTLIGIYIILTEDWLLTPRLYWADWGASGLMSPLVKIFYKSGFGSYLYGLILIIFFEPRQKDFGVMVSHHFVTLTLLTLSYLWPYHRVGAAILVLHDCSDPIMELAKMALYAGMPKIADVLFATFAATFIVMRNFVFPAFIIRSIFQYAYDTPHPVLAMGISVRDVAVVGLCLLEVFHLYWATLILKMAKRAVMDKGVSDDTRNLDAE
ncbi:hypothetical protein HKX48_002070 [Thoreauomyces humboldtii]|nr:hypothetical protein HKX48_002070 [Thoreauomyces humboldtii]